jgi:hypothetical protein
MTKSNLSSRILSVPIAQGEARERLIKTLQLIHRETGGTMNLHASFCAAAFKAYVEAQAACDAARKAYAKALDAVDAAASETTKARIELGKRFLKEPK